MADVVAPPYDVISPEQQSELYDRHPANVIRLILGREEEPYSAAAQKLSEWMQSGIFVRDPMPSLYLLAQDFTLPDGRRLRRRGFIAACRLEGFGKGTIMPHEKTLPGPKEDRLKLFRATGAMFSQIMALYNDPGGLIDAAFQDARQQPYRDLVFDGVRNRMWRVSDPEMIELVADFLRDRRVFVADGHHRYETALLYRDSSPGVAGTPAEFIPMYFASMNDPGLVILPTHRILHSLPSFDGSEFLKKLGGYFHLKNFDDQDDLEAALVRGGRGTFGLIQKKASHLLTMKDRSLLIRSGSPEAVAGLDVAILHTVILEKILGISNEDQLRKVYLDYVKDVTSAASLVSEGKAQAAFLLNATPVDQVREVAEAGLTMPQKSTYFYPKLLSGMVTYSFQDW